MKLELHLMAGLPGAPETTASVVGDTLTVDGVEYDLSGVPEGGLAEPQGSDHPFVGSITRHGGTIHAAIIWRYDDSTAEADQGTEHPVLSVSSGPVPDPVKRLTEQEGEV